MIYIMGTFGLILGFFIGQMVLYFLLRNVPKDDLLNDRYIKWKYGLLCWIIAILGSYVFSNMYAYYFN